MATKGKPYDGQEILNRVFTGTALRSASTDTGSSSATTGGKLDHTFTDQSIFNSSVGVTNAELLADGLMEAAGTTAWTAGGGATLTKETGVRPNGVGGQVLRVAGNATFAQQTIGVAGTKYRITGWARGDGTAAPKVYNGTPGSTWNGTTSTDWQRFDLSTIYISGSARVALFCDGDGYVEFDDVSVKQITSADADGVLNLA